MMNALRASLVHHFLAAAANRLIFRYVRLRYTEQSEYNRLGENQIRVQSKSKANKTRCSPLLDRSIERLLDCGLDLVYEESPEVQRRWKYQPVTHF
jgi:hypothetical protein